MSLTPPLLARNITNLTDARYFAAWQPDYLFFAPQLLHPDQQQTLQAIQAWIEGPKWGVELPSLFGNDLDLLIPAIDPFDAMMVHVEQLKHLQESSAKPILKISIPKQNHNLNVKSCDLLIPPDPPLLSDLLKNTQERVWVEIALRKEWDQIRTHLTDRCGIVISGTDEDQPGLKSFDEVETLLETIYPGW